MLFRHRLVTKSLLIALVIALTACSGAEGRKAKHMQKGNELFARQNYEKARLEYKNILQIDPKDVAGRYALAQTLEKMEKFRAAAGHYLRVIELDPNHTQAKIRMGRIYLAARAIDKADTLVEDTLALSQDNADALALRGAIKLVRGDKPGALVAANRALAVEPANLDAVSLLSGIYVAEKNTAKAVAVLEDGIKNNPQNHQLRVLLAGIYANAQQYAEAIATLQQLIELDVQNLQYRLQLARFYHANAQPQQAQQVLRDAVTAVPESSEAKLELANYLFAAENAEAAEQQLKTFILNEPDNYELKFGLADLYMRSKNTAAASDIYREVIDKDNTQKHGLIARNRLARILITGNKVSEAKKLLAEVLISNTQDIEALTMRGTIALADREYAAAIADFRSVLRNQPDAAKVLTLLARTHALNGETELAKEQYEKAIQAAPRETEARLELSQLLVTENNVTQAEQLITAAVKADPRDKKALEALFKLHIAKKNTDGALQVANMFKQAYPQDVDGYYAAALIYQGLQQYDKSNQELVAGMAKNDHASKLLAVLIKNYLAQKRDDDAINYLRGVIKKQPGHAVAYNILGEIYLSKQDLQQAQQAFARAKQIRPDWPIPYRNLAIIYMQQKNEDAAVKEFLAGQEATQGSPMLSYGLAALYEKLGKVDQAITLFEDIVNKSPDSRIASNNLAMLLVTYRGADQQSLHKALKLVEPLQDSDNPNFLDTLGWVYHKSGDNKAALPYLTRAANQAPQIPIIQYHLGMALFKDGNKDSAKQRLQQALQTRQPFIGIEEAKQTLARIENDG